MSILENKEALIAEKLNAVKHADAVFYVQPTNKGVKANANATELMAKLVINTTNLMDSHDDVHINGIWDNSLKENAPLLLQEHQMQFDKVISDEVKAYVADVSWKELGQPFDGMTQALIFEAKISKERNPFMFDQYAKGFVKNHSVGMRYKDLQLAVADAEDNTQEKINWDTYLPQIANQQKAIDKGYFWVVKEAEVIEGSAVLRGSNFATPTLEINEPNKGLDWSQILQTLKNAN